MCGNQVVMQQLTVGDPTVGAGPALHDCRALHLPRACRVRGSLQVAGCELGASTTMLSDDDWTG